MTDLCQGDIIRVSGFSNCFLVISKNAFIRSTGVFHVCVIAQNSPAGPLHIPLRGAQGTEGVVFCEQLKLLDPDARACSRIDRISYYDMMNISDAIQGIIEYE